MLAYDLLNATDRFLGEASITYRDRQLAHLRAQLERDMRDAFYTQGEVFTGKLQPALPGWEGLFDEAAEETEALFVKPIVKTIKLSLTIGGDAMWRAAQIVGSFDLANPLAVRYVAEHGAKLVAGINDTTQDYLRTVIQKGVDEGWSYDRIAKAITERYSEFAVGRPQQHIDSRAHMIAVTECFPGDVSIASFARPIPALPVGSGGSGMFGDRLRSGTQPAISGAARRWYEGDIVEITTASGHKLTGTPNHPILTDKGWVPLNRLTEGDNVICYDFGKWMGFGDPYIEDAPAKISQKFDALCSRRGAIVKRVAGTVMDFHGDGKPGKVEIVTSGCYLWRKRESAFCEPSRQNAFSLSYLRKALFAALGAIGKTRLAFGMSLGSLGIFGHMRSCRGMGSAQIFAPLVGAAIGPGLASGFRHIANVDIGLSQYAKNPIFRDAITISDTLTGFAAGVTRDRIVGINRLQYAGHVYNLHTSLGYYTANGVIVQNCGNAYEAGNRIVAESLGGHGLDMEKSWLTAQDDRVCSDECQINEAQGWIPMQEPFASGHQQPLAHPSCRCSALYRRKPGAKA